MLREVPRIGCRVWNSLYVMCVYVERLWKDRGDGGGGGGEGKSEEKTGNENLGSLLECFLES